MMISIMPARAGALPAAIIVACSLLCGCARERVEVTVGKNGAWTRRAMYIVSNLDVTGGTNGKNGAKLSEVTDSFVLPTGAGWKFTNQITKDEKRVIAEKTLPLDQAIENDIVMKGAVKPDLGGDKSPAPKVGATLVRTDDPPKSAKTLTSNHVSVRQVSPGRYVYSETLHWTGEVPANMHKLDVKVTDMVRAALPSELATDENVSFVANTFSKEFDLVMVGPPSPLIHRLPMLMSAPEVFVRLITRRAGKGLLGALKEKYGDKMTAEQRYTLTQKLIQGITDEMRESGPAQAGDAQGSESSNDTTGASLFVAVKLPGRVVETNGIADPFSGEITWSLYPEAAAFGDVTLTATCDTNAKSGTR